MNQGTEQEWHELLKVLKVMAEEVRPDSTPIAFQELMGPRGCCSLQIGDAKLEMLKKKERYEFVTYNAELKGVYRDIPPSSFSLKTILADNCIFWTGLDTDIPQPWTTAGLATELIRKLTDLYVKSQSAPLRPPQ
jgi:hypothetical protein